MWVLSLRSLILRLPLPRDPLEMDSSPTRSPDRPAWLTEPAASYIRPPPVSNAKEKRSGRPAARSPRRPLVPRNYVES